MRLAYADPPYPGQAKRLYGRESDPFTGEVGEVDHAELLAQLCEYDGWALSTSMVALRDVLWLSPAGVVVAAWYVTNAAPAGAAAWLHWYSWEPVIVSPARARPDVRNVLVCHSPMGFHVTNKGEPTLPGRKPERFARWVFSLIGAEPEDTFEDLFPGSGIVGREWDLFARQPALF